MPPGLRRAERMELKVIINPIGQAGPARCLLSNLFYGSGYNFYRCESEPHADDLLIRHKLSQLLQDSRAHLVALQAAFLRKYLPPGRDRTFASSAAVGVQVALERAQRELEAMETGVMTAAAPEVGCIRRDNGSERGTLVQLVALDGDAVLALVTLRDAIARFDNGAAAAVAIDDLLRASDFSALWSRRQALLSVASE